MHVPSALVLCKAFMFCDNVNTSRSMCSSSLRRAIIIACEFSWVQSTPVVDHASMTRLRLFSPHLCIVDGGNNNNDYFLFWYCFYFYGNYVVDDFMDDEVAYGIGNVYHCNSWVCMACALVARISKAVQISSSSASISCNAFYEHCHVTLSYWQSHSMSGLLSASPYIGFSSPRVSNSNITSDDYKLRPIRNSTSIVHLIWWYRNEFAFISKYEISYGNNSDA